MKNPLCSSDEDENDQSPTSIAPYCWWRSDANFDECVHKQLKLHHELPNACGLTPRTRVLKELERLALVATHEGLNELRHKLLMYRSGDFWMPIGGISKDKMDIPPVATILLVGFSASGKSSLVNLMYSVLGRSGLIPFAQTSSSSAAAAASAGCSRNDHTTMFLKEHNVLRSLRSGFCVYDSRGFHYDQLELKMGGHESSPSLEEQLSSWMNDGVKHNQVCLRSGDAALMKDDDMALLMSESSSKFVRRRVNCAMVVANMAEMYKAFRAGDSKPMEATKQLFCSNAFRNCNDEKPILILTHGDMLSTEERIDGRLKICECLGISETSGVYDIVCLTEYGFLAQESDPVSAYALTEAVYRALLISDRTHLPKKTHHDWALLILFGIMAFLGSLFSLLAHICFKLGQRDKKLLKY